MTANMLLSHLPPYALQIAILLTNQVQCRGPTIFSTSFLSSYVTADPGATLSFAPGGAMKPIGGHILSHASATRMALRKGLIYILLVCVLTVIPDHNTGRAEERVAKLVDSPDRPESEASYKLDNGGWADV